ncbi:olfactory receptor 5AR1-like [Pelodytes ibericus]
MLGNNQSLVTVFYFDGLTENMKVQMLLFPIFLVVYIFTIVGNGGMIYLITRSPNLHTPMYFFLKHLSFIDMCYSSVIIPRILSDIVSIDKAIPFVACALQMYFYGTCVNIECLLLAMMAYDRYAAICRPLHYHTIMGREVCIILTAVCYIDGLFNAMIHTRNTFTQVYCKSNRIAHYFCDAPPILKLSCSDTSTTELVISAIVGINLFASVLMVVIPYTYIFSTILQIKSALGREKAIATCSSHLLSIGILFGTLLFMYMRPNSDHLRNQDKVVSLFYTVVIPMLNPIIYSLRNKDVKKAFLKVRSLK